LFLALFEKDSWMKVFSYGTAYLIAVLFIRYAKNNCWTRIFSTYLNASSMLKLIKPAYLYKYLLIFPTVINVFNDVYFVVCINKVNKSLYKKFIIILNIILLIIIFFCSVFLLFFYPKVDFFLIGIFLCPIHALFSLIITFLPNPIKT